MATPNPPRTSRLLIHEQPLQVLPGLAVILGLNEAIILQQLHYWLLRQSHTREGEEWHYNTYVDWKKQFPFWSVSTIKRAILHLEEVGVVIAANFNNSNIDKTKWYRINYEKLNELCDASTAQIEPSTGQDEPSTAQIEPSTGQDEPSMGQIDTMDGSDCAIDSKDARAGVPEINTEITDRDLPPSSPQGESEGGLTGFQQFWNTYPKTRRTGKRAALELWVQQDLEPRTADILEKLTALTQHHPDWQRQKEPSPLRWLREKCYDDDLYTPADNREQFIAEMEEVKGKLWI
jgi:hypothetical protein